MTSTTTTSTTTTSTTSAKRIHAFLRTCGITDEAAGLYAEELENYGCDEIDDIAIALKDDEFDKEKIFKTLHVAKIKEKLECAASSAPHIVEVVEPADEVLIFTGHRVLDAGDGLVRLEDMTIHEFLRKTDLGDASQRVTQAEVDEIFNIVQETGDLPASVKLDRNHLVHRPNAAWSPNYNLMAATNSHAKHKDGAYLYTPGQKQSLRRLVVWDDDTRTRDKQLRMKPQTLRSLVKIATDHGFKQLVVLGCANEKGFGFDSDAIGAYWFKGDGADISPALVHDLKKWMQL